jgi:hypothetical protein
MPTPSSRELAKSATAAQSVTGGGGGGDRGESGVRQEVRRLLCERLGMEECLGFALGRTRVFLRTQVCYAKYYTCNIRYACEVLLSTLHLLSISVCMAGGRVSGGD